jgi:hypothetical protein
MVPEINLAEKPKAKEADPLHCFNFLLQQTGFSVDHF